jgi:hypothetical protein
MRDLVRRYTNVTSGMDLLTKPFTLDGLGVKSGKSSSLSPQPAERRVSDTVRESGYGA